MCDTETEEICEEQPIPAHIDEDFLKSFLDQTDTYIRDLRLDGNFETAKFMVRIVTVLENVVFQLRDEEQKVRHLQEQRVDATYRIEEATKISQRDNDIIQQLKKDLLRAWSLADTSNIREQHTSETLDAIQRKCEALDLRLQKYTLRGDDESDDFGEHKSAIIKEVDRMHTKIEELHRRLFVQRAYSDELQKQLDVEVKKNRDLFQEWDAATSETLAGKENIEKLSKKNKELSEDQEKLSENLVRFQGLAEKRVEILQEREKKIEELSSELEIIREDNALIRVTKKKMEAAVSSYKSELASSQHETKQLQNYARLKDDENRKLVSALEQESKKIEILRRKLADTERAVSKVEQELALRKNEILTVEKEKSALLKANENMLRENRQLANKDEARLKEIERLNGGISSLKRDVETVKDEAAKFKADLKIAIEQGQQANVQVRRLSANIEVVIGEKKLLGETIKDLDIEVREKAQEIGEHEVAIEEARKTIKRLNDEYGVLVRELKETESKFQQSEEKEADTQYRWSLCKDQLASVKQRLVAKNLEAQKLLKKVMRLKKMNTDAKIEHAKTTEMLRLCRVDVKQLRGERDDFKDELDACKERLKQLKLEHERVIRERDLMATQMFRRSDENALLVSEMTTLKMTIERSNAAYNERMEDIRVLKCEVKKLRMHCDALKRALENTTDMRHEVLRLHRMLNQERVQSKVLCAEMATPMNVHRWRKLNSNDPTRMELISKCQRLQRKSIVQFSQITKAEEIIKCLQEKISKQEKEIDKRADVDLQKKLLFTRVQMQKNEKKMKSAVAISRATEGDVIFKEHTITQMQSELDELKSRLLKERREKQNATGKLLLLKKNKENGH